MTLTKASVLAALLAAFASAKLGYGDCPTVSTVPTPFGSSGTVADGQYHLMSLDSQFKWGAETFARLKGEDYNCEVGSLTKTSTGFTWS